MTEKQFRKILYLLFQFYPGEYDYLAELEQSKFDRLCELWHKKLEKYDYDFVYNFVETYSVKELKKALTSLKYTPLTIDALLYKLNEIT